MGSELAEVKLWQSRSWRSAEAEQWRRRTWRRRQRRRLRRFSGAGGAGTGATRRQHWHAEGPPLAVMELAAELGEAELAEAEL